MAFFYMDTDAGSDANNGTTWALAKLTLEGLIAVMSAGDVGFVQGVADDTDTVDRTFTSPGTVDNPCKILGVKDGTTNEGVSIATTDLVVRGIDTLPKISVTGVSADILFSSGFTYWYGLDFSTGDRLQYSANTDYLGHFTDCKLTCADRINLENDHKEVVWVNCEYEPTAAAVFIRCRNGAKMTVYGGELANTASPSNFMTNDTDGVKFFGFDLTNLGNNNLHNGGPYLKENVLTNCKVPATYTISGVTPTAQGGITLIGCNSGSSKGVTTSYQDYYRIDAHGTVEDESTIVRTGGADDGASGGFSYAMTPHVDATLESAASLKSPWMAVWVNGGSNTLTIYIANDTASTDFNEDEVWVEFYTPDAGDTAQHDQNFDPALARLLDSTTIITDDTGSTWGTGGNNHQKMSVSVTTGFEGWAYARLHFAKRYASSPATLYLDPKIAVT